MKKLNEALLNNLKEILLEDLEEDLITWNMLCHLLALFFTTAINSFFKSKIEEPGIAIENLVLIYLLFSQSFFLIYLGCVKSSYLKTIKKGYLYLIHLFYPGKSFRKKEAAFFMLNHRNSLQEMETSYFLNQAKFNSISRASLPEWIKDNVSEEPSLVKLFEQRTTLSSALLPMTLDLFYWSQLIPVKLFKLDHLKLALYSAQLIEPTELDKLPTPSPQDFQDLFKNYTSENLVLLFTTPFLVTEYIALLKTALKNKEALVVKPNVRELYLWTKNLERIKEKQIFNFKRGPLSYYLEGLSPLGEIKAITNTIEMEYSGMQLGNCWRNYETKYYNSIKEVSQGVYYLFGIYQENKLVLGLKTTSYGIIVEVKKSGNRTTTPQETIDLQNHIAKVIRDNNLINTLE